MAEINAAYASVRTRDRRHAYDRTRHPVQPNAAPIVPPPTSTWRPPVRASAGEVDFGRYAGWTLEQLARHDPDYLRLLSRHSSGIRNRRRAETPHPGSEGRPPLGQLGHRHWCRTASHEPIWCSLG